MRIYSAGLKQNNKKGSFEEMVQRGDLGQGWSNANFTELFEKYNERKEIPDEEIKEILIEAGYGSHTLSVFRHMLKNIEEGDYIFARNGDDILGVGKVVGEPTYEYWEDTDYRFPNRIKPVKWYTPDWLKDYESLIPRAQGVVKVHTNKDRGKEIIRRLKGNSEDEINSSEFNAKKGIQEILDKVFLDHKDVEDAQKHFVKLFTYLNGLDDLKTNIVTTYRSNENRISVNFGAWQLFSIKRKGDTYFSLFAVDSSKLPKGYKDWPEFEKDYEDFKNSEEIRLITTQWENNLLQKYPELETAWKHAVKNAKSKFGDWEKSNYSRYHNNDIYEWIVEGIPKYKSSEKKEKLIEINNSELKYGDGNFTKGLFFPDDMENDINKSIKSAIKSGKNIVLTGPPGTGKTKIAKSISRELQKRNKAMDGFIFTTATADWTTFDTIGGYHPEKESNTLQFKPGQFLKCFKDKDGEPINKWLIIDEINRADIDKAFGQLFSVLSKDTVELPFTTENEETITIASINREIDQDFEYSDSDYYVTRNWRLLATMNTYDKASLYEMSYAFMRRFAFIDVGIPTEEINEELLKNYIEVWSEIELNKVISHLEDISVVWTILNDGKRAVGPAIIRDILLFLQETPDGDGLVNGLKLYVLPQLEGMIKSDQEKILNKIKEILGSQEQKKLERIAKMRFEIDLEVRKDG